VSIGGEKPESGVRIVLVRPRESCDAPWSYQGMAHLAKVCFPLRVTTANHGAVKVEVGASGDTQPPADLPERVRLIVRTVLRQASAEGRPPPWKIARWRPANGP
jgi:hypothetical protein